MVTIREAGISDAERILEIYDYYVRNTAITFPSGASFVIHVNKACLRRRSRMTTFPI